MAQALSIQTIQKRSEATSQRYRRHLFIGEEGFYWLKVHVANNGRLQQGLRPYEERVKWTEDNAAMIAAIALTPLRSCDGYKRANRSWFLAACMEFASAYSAGNAYVSHLPVSWDVSCSGLQHLCSDRSASLR